MSRPPRRIGPATLSVAAVTVGGAALAVDRVRRLQAWRADRAAAVPEHHDLPAEAVTLRSKGDLDLHAWWVPAAQGGLAPTVLVVHGFASHAGDMLPLGALLHHEGFHVLLLDLRGHGRSERSAERPRPHILAEDVLTAAEWLRAREDVGPLGLVGHSMGGAVAIFAASASDDFDAVVSVAGIADPTLSRIGWWPAAVSRLLIRAVTAREMLDEPPRFAVHRVPDVSAPLMLIHGDRDQVVPIAHAHALHAAAPHAELVIVPGAGHASVEDFSPALVRAVTFLRDALAAEGRLPA